MMYEGEVLLFTQVYLLNLSLIHESISSGYDGITYTTSPVLLGICFIQWRTRRTRSTDLAVLSPL